jgi:beta-galactosidase
MRIGVQYYPEHWPKERWKIDAEMMQRAGVSLVRMGEFAWSAYEPREGEVNFGWMEQAIELLGRHGIQTLLCTCSRTPPPWAYLRYPGILNSKPDGRLQFKDERYRVGLAHEEFLTLSRRIDGQVIRHFAGCDNITAWQVDNEIGSGNDCYCAQCQKAFQDYLKEKYGSPEALNAAWGQHFWSFSVADFAEVPVCGSHPQRALEYRRFQSRLNTAFTQWRTDLIHAEDPGKPVTANFQNAYAAHTDVHELATAIDVNGMNHYPSRTPELAIDYYRGRRGTLWALEQHTRLRDVDTPDGRMRLWAWMTAAHGASTIVHFRWRQCRWGAEQFGDGILPHSGEPNRFYRELQRMGKELQQIGSQIAETRPHAPAAIVYSYESRWGVEVSGFGEEMDPVHEAAHFHKALGRRVTAIDAMHPREPLASYALVIAPRLWVVDRSIAANLRAYVENGGTLCLTVGTGMVDVYGKGFETPRPGLLSELAGIAIHDLAFHKGMPLPLSGVGVAKLDTLQGSTAAEEIYLEGAAAIATHACGWRKGMPAITLHSLGKGRVVYVGVSLDAASIELLTAWLCQLSGIRPLFTWPRGISVYERRGDTHRFLFVINWTDHPMVVEPGEMWKDAFSGEPVKQISIASNDLRILQKDRER